MTERFGEDGVSLYPGCFRDMKRGGAIIEGGHFVSGSGMHSNTWVDLSAVTIRPKFIENCVQALDQNGYREAGIVTGPSFGADAFAQWFAYYSEAKFAIPIEKQVVNGKPEWSVREVFRKHFQSAAEKGGIILCDDVLHTGSTFAVALKILLNIVPKESIRGVVVILNRGDFTDTFEELPLRALVSEKFPEYEARHCPFCKDGVPVRTDFGVGARFLRELAKQGHAKQAQRLGWTGKL